MHGKRADHTCQQNRAEETAVEIFENLFQHKRDSRERSVEGSRQRSGRSRGDRRAPALLGNS